MQLPEHILKKAKYWAESKHFDLETRKEVASLFADNNLQEITDRFFEDLSFGTGGMRGIMGAGSCRMNAYNIRKASTALACYLKDTFPGKEIKIAIAYDSRHRSYDFAKIAAEVLAAHHMKVLLTKQMRPVPMLSFMVRHFHCQAGICITASHNPPNYNGFKVYWQSGGQLTPPHDRHILKRYQEIEDYGQLAFLPFSQALQEERVVEVGEELDAAYFHAVASLALRKPEEKAPLKIVYSPIHGTGIFAVPRALEIFGFHDILIPESQKNPDGSFPTVHSPNPEEPEALSIALQLAQETHADLVLATDPDADRLACITRENESFVAFNGNQLCSLLCDYVLSTLKEKGQWPKDALVISTIVTSPLCREIAAYHGAHYEETLTGFKWIGQRIEEYELGQRQAYRHFVCGGEESYGFLAGKFVRDKDAVSACALAAEMVAYYKHRGESLSQVLHRLFKRHKVYAERLHSLVLAGQAGAEQTAAIMAYLRQNPPALLGSTRLVRMSDYKNRLIKTYSDGQWQTSGSPEQPSADVLQFELSDGSRLSIRPSGTEPKIKLYLSVAIDPAKYPDQSLEKLCLEAERLASQHESEFTALVNTLN